MYFKWHDRVFVQEDNDDFDGDNKNYKMAINVTFNYPFKRSPNTSRTVPSTWQLLFKVVFEMGKDGRGRGSGCGGKSGWRSGSGGHKKPSLRSMADFISAKNVPHAVDTKIVEQRYINTFEWMHAWRHYDVIATDSSPTSRVTCLVKIPMTENWFQLGIVV